MRTPAAICVITVAAVMAGFENTARAYLLCQDFLGGVPVCDTGYGQICNDAGGGELDCTLDPAGLGSYSTDDASFRTDRMVFAGTVQLMVYGVDSQGESFCCDSYDMTLTDPDLIKLEGVDCATQSDIITIADNNLSSATEIFGYAGDDEIRDTRLGGAGILVATDWIEGGPGNDTIQGGYNDDELYGGLGDDWIEGGHGSDYLSAGDHADTNNMFAGFTNWLFGGQGADELVGSAESTVGIWFNVDYMAGGSSGADTSMADGADTMTGNSGDDLMCGNYGADTMSGGNGSDTIYGGAGVDIINGGLAIDHCEAGATCEDLTVTSCPSFPAYPY